ncbi:uncharacterized protein LOC133786139 [Humulus lupulus]|uniref:uncharacterized protein LOC133786139 n=1 Tax=Humulus lupulus TaxID=3486 RepID=UPI002B403BB7|nr:uncharacterized protein LOC133786139 [Humulus lupulus]
MYKSTFKSTKMDINNIRRRRPSYRVIVFALVFSAVFIWSAKIVLDCKWRLSAWNLNTTRCHNSSETRREIDLPRGIVTRTSDLQMKPLWGPRIKKNPKVSTNLLAMAVGIKMKENVNTIVNKFLKSNFVVMLFHYDGNVSEWRDLEWSDRAIHVSAINQTKWWFAKRFMHPDIISDYSYIFLWDEDLGVEHFNVDRYMSIVKEEGLHISQPALDPTKSEIHHALTARVDKQRLHRKVYRTIGRWKCDENSTEPPCTGFVEMMAPVFSISSWRCAWHLIQNDLIYAWGVDFVLGYCAQGDRTKNVGIIDSEYLIHYGLPTLGGSTPDKVQAETETQARARTQTGNQTRAQSPKQHDIRYEVRKLSYAELEIFKNRWKKAVKEDEVWSSRQANIADTYTNSYKVVIL